MAAMPPSSRDPRSYVKPVALPVQSQKGIRIQARSATVYNPTVPDRDEVRRENYRRRQQQLSQQGFQSPAFRPYQAIGDPFYLDQKRLILHALGQWEEGQELDDSSSAESEDDATKKQENLGMKKCTSRANFLLRRTRKDLNTLNKEIDRNRHLERNVRLGHGLFDAVRHQLDEKLGAKARAELKRKQEKMNEWQPPKFDSSSEDETDDELLEEEDLRKYLTSSVVMQTEEEASLANTPVPPADRADQEIRNSKVAFQGLTVPSQAITGTTSSSKPASVRSRSASARSRSSRTPKATSRKHLPLARPYTPQHCNIVSDRISPAETQAVFRQLCALFWLLEAMNVEQTVAMAPIVTSWNLKDIGGGKTTVVFKQQMESRKRNDSKWKQFVSNNQHLRETSSKPKNKFVVRAQGITTVFKTLGMFGGKRQSMSRTTQRTPRRVSMGLSRNSLSSSTSPSASQTQLNTIPGSPVTIQVDASFDKSEENSAENEDNSRGLFRFLDEYYDSLHKEGDGSGEGISDQDAYSARSQSPGVSPHTSPTTTRRHRDRGAGDGDQVDRGKRGSTAKDQFFKQLASINRSHDDPRLHALAHPGEKRTSREMRADVIVRPKSTPAVLEYQANLPSTRMSGMTLEMRQKFDEVTEEKALLLHDALEAKDRQRLNILRNKFVHLPTEGSSFHRAVEKMRIESIKDDDDSTDKEMSRRSSETHLAWYMELLHHIPAGIQNEWYVRRIVDKLGKYGKLGSSKQSAYKFLNVLQGLRDWEVCCPDVCAAIEFCREKIVEVSVEEYEEWFRRNFPAVARPQTAPPALRNERREAGACKPGSHNVPKSAPPGIRRHEIASL